MSDSFDSFAIVVGAGPAGLLLSLLLAQQNVPVLLLEKSNKLDEQPRATHYQAPAVAVLHRAGVADAIRAEAGDFAPQSICWRTLSNKRLTGIEHQGTAKDFDRMVCLPLNQVSKILLDRLVQLPSATVRWEHEITGLREEHGLGVVEVSTPDGPKELRARFVAGCDGANSKVRRCLFGDLNFPGKTWDVQVVATNVYYDFHQFGFEDANFIVDPEHWYMAAKITKDGMWRVSYGEAVDKSKEQLLQEQPEKWRKMLPGSPTPQDYKITNFSPYKVHQRIAESMRVGPFVLAADAAHLCNPFGGLGLTGGIVDVGGLFDCLLGIYQGKADDSILDTYAHIRKQKWEQFINPISSQNIETMYDDDPETLVDRHSVFQMMKEALKNEAKMKEFIKSIYAIDFDFTQHYRSRVDGKISSERGIVNMSVAS